MKGSDASVKPYKYAPYLQISNKKQLVPYSETPSPNAPAVPGNVFSITTLKTIGGEGEKCLSDLFSAVRKFFSPSIHWIHRENTSSPNSSRNEGLYSDTINLLGLDKLWGHNNADRLDGGLYTLTKHFHLSGQCQVYLLTASYLLMKKPWSRLSSCLTS